MEESSTGHTAPTSAPQELKATNMEVEEHERKQRPGESDSQRSLGDINEPVRKKLKSINEKVSLEKETEHKDEVAEIYQHIKEGQDSNTQVINPFH